MCSARFDSMDSSTLESFMHITVRSGAGCCQLVRAQVARNQRLLHDILHASILTAVRSKEVAQEDMYGQVKSANTTSFQKKIFQAILKRLQVWQTALPSDAVSRAAICGEDQEMNDTTSTTPNRTEECCAQQLVTLLTFSESPYTPLWSTCHTVL